jgi:hypothetical protein
VRSLPRSLALIATLTLTGGLAACGSDDGATASFTTPGDGAKVAGGVDVELTAEGITIEEAGEVHDDAGHFHVLADTGCATTGDAIAKDADHVHLGKGQSDATIYLGPGEHELCVQVGDGAHHALDVTDTISIDVGIDDLDQWCSVVGEVDGMFYVIDNSPEDFGARQVSYENAGRLLAQLQASIDLVDADQRELVATAVDAAGEMAEAMATAADEAAAEAQLSGMFDASDDIEPAAGWILDTCRVSITD